MPRRRTRSACLLALALISSSLLAPSGSSGTSTQTWVPMIRGDFDCDGRTDVMRYVPGRGYDRVLYGSGGRRFLHQWFTVNGSYRPFSGDFNGDGCDDVFLYAPGTTVDHVLFGRADREFSRRALHVDGLYAPVVGDFDGDGRTDVLWYARGTAPDPVWFGRNDRSFDRTRTTINGTYEAFAGDFDGDLKTDVFLYGEGSTPDYVLFGTPERTFSRHGQIIGGTYEPLAGDFDGSGSTDILWYAPGPAPDALWTSRPTRAFDPSPLSIGGAFSPVVGDFDGDDADDVFWYQAGTAQDHVWYGSLTVAFARVSVRVDGTYRPFGGDFDGDGAEDVFLDGGSHRSYVFFGTPDRAFVPKRAVSRAHRVAPFRPGALTTSYSPFGFVAHALGGVDGLAYTNSLEAFTRNHARGFRLFEVDLVLLADGSVLAAHDKLEPRYGLSKSFRDSTRRDLVNKKYLGKYTILWAQDIIRLMRSHPNTYFVLDTKWSHVTIWRKLVAMARSDAIVHRMLPHIADDTDLRAHREVYPVENYVLALYRTQPKDVFDDAEVVRFVRVRRVPAVMMWYRDRNPRLSLRENASESRRWLPSFARDLQEAGAAVYVHTVKYDGQVPKYRIEHAGVYSDETFAPS